MSESYVIKIKREILLGAAKTTLLETEEIKTRTAEQVASLVQKLHDNGARHYAATVLLNEAECSTEDEIAILPNELAAIADHIPER